MKKIIIFVVAFLIALIQPYVIKYSHSFEVSGSSRVPTIVPRDQNLRDPQYVSARVISAEPAYKVVYYNNAGLVCGHEQVPINTTDNRNFLQKILFPRGPVYTETQYNCYNTPGAQEQRVFAGYMVTFEHLGNHYQRLVDHHPGKYIRILIK